MRGYHVYKVLWSCALDKHSLLCAKLILNRDQLVKYLGFPLPELEIIYPICVKGCQKIRDAEFLEDVQIIFLCISENRFAQKNIFLPQNNQLLPLILYSFFSYFASSFLLFSLLLFFLLHLLLNCSYYPPTFTFFLKFPPSIPSSLFQFLFLVSSQ